MLDWDDLRYFLALARHGTLAAAARELHVTQSTVGRRIASLQAGLGVRLLHRTSDGHVLTLAGETIRAHVERVEQEAQLVEHAVAGHDQKLGGVVRVTSAQFVASHLLTPCFSALHLGHPEILIESYLASRADVLGERDSDISVSLRRFDNPAVIMRSIGVIAYGLYACVTYLARFGEPDLGSGCPSHNLITLLDHPVASEQTEWLAACAGRATVVLKADSYETQYHAAASSGGLALLPRFRADPDPALRLITTPDPPPSATLWLGVHVDNRAVPRVRIVLDCIAEAMRGRSKALNPDGASPAEAPHVEPG